MKKPVLLLDVDGVLNVLETRDLDKRRIRLPDGHSFYPSSFTLEFLKWAWRKTRVLWLSNWQIGAHAISQWASLPERQVLLDRRRKDEFFIDWKLREAKRIHFHNPDRLLFWMDDELPQDRASWVAGERRVHFIKTNARTGVTARHVKEMEKLMENRE